MPNARDRSEVWRNRRVRLSQQGRITGRLGPTQVTYDRLMPIPSEVTL